METLSILLIFWATFTVAVVTPGPNFAVISGTSLRSGGVSALMVAVGMVIGEAIWGLAAVLGVAALATKQPWIATALQIGGGCVLLYLGVLSLRSAFRPSSPREDGADGENPEASTFGFWQGLWHGTAMMLLNAKAGVFWISMTGLILGSSGTEVGLLAVAGALVISFVWHAALALALTTGMVQRAYARLRRGLEFVLGTLLAGIGLRLIVSEG